MDCRRKRISRSECARWNQPRTSNSTPITTTKQKPYTGNDVPIHPYRYTGDDVPVGPFLGMDLDSDPCPCGGCPAPIPPCHHLRPPCPPPGPGCCGPYDPCSVPPDHIDKIRHRVAYENRQRRSSTNQRFNDCADAFFKDFGFGLGNAKTDAEIERKLNLEKFMRAECSKYIDECFGDGSKYGMKNLESIKEGDVLVYKRRCFVTVVKVYKELVPYFDVKFRDGTIVQTEASNLYIPPCSPPSHFHCRSAYPWH